MVRGPSKVGSHSFRRCMWILWSIHCFIDRGSEAVGRAKRTARIESYRPWLADVIWSRWAVETGQEVDNRRKAPIPSGGCMEKCMEKCMKKCMEKYMEKYMENYIDHSRRHRSRKSRGQIQSFCNCITRHLFRYGRRLRMLGEG